MHDWKWNDRNYLLTVLDDDVVLVQEGLSFVDLGVPLLLFSLTCDGGVGLCDWPVLLYIAATQARHSFSSSVANNTVSPSLVALKKCCPPLSSANTEQIKTLILCWSRIRGFVCFFSSFFSVQLIVLICQCTVDVKIRFKFNIEMFYWT